MSAKNMDKKNRFRSKTIGFRVSPEEWASFEQAVELSGLTKQDYMIARIEQREIVVQGNPRVYRALREELKEVMLKLEEISKNQCENIESEVLDTIKLINLTLNGLKNEN
ncbi:MAG: hypothetical protein R3Y09_02625 [Clostridia bacterium]